MPRVRTPELMFARLCTDLVITLGLFTRLPTGWLTRFMVQGDMSPDALRRSVWLWPWAGALTGLLTALVLSLARLAGVPAAAAAVCAVAVQILLTGGLHEDGLADTADGLGGGRTREQRLDIMRDSRVGSYGVLALGLALLLRVSCYAALPANGIFAVLMTAGTLSKAVIPALLMSMPPARKDGLAACLSDLHSPVVSAAFVLTGLTVFALEPPFLALEALAGAFLPVLVLRRLALRGIGGFTGDILGAAALLAEAGSLLVLSAR